MKEDSFREKISYIITIILAISFGLSGILEFYFLVLNRDKPFAYSQMTGINKVLFIMLFVLLFVMALMFLLLLIFGPKEYDPYKNYTVVHKDTYKDMEKELLNKEIENMHQDLEIKTLKVRLSSLKLKFNIFKKIFKHIK